jgi:hypothetical protein
MVAMDSGLLESRLDRLDAPDRMVGVKARAHGPRLMDRLSERT